MFVAINGTSSNGENFIAEAIKRGAIKIIVHKSFDKKNCIHGVDYKFVNDTRIALAKEAAKAARSPAKKLKIFAITGTKGKTTSAWMLEHIFKKNNFNPALLSSAENRILEKSESAPLTTLPADYIQQFLAEALRCGVTHVVMEVSSHGLSLKRVHGVEFEAIGFTNLARDHLDFYGTMEKYFAAKLEILDHLKPNGHSVVGISDDWGRIFSDKSTKLGFRTDTFDHEFSCEHFKKIREPFNKDNAAMAIKLATAAGIDEIAAIESLKDFPGVPGRLQRHRMKNGATGIVDFAHNPVAMESVLAALREETDNLIIVFGCGGCKDHGRRPRMGAIASKYADKIIITNDNPRTEDPNVIAQEILQGIQLREQSKIIIELDRETAVSVAASNSQKESIVVLLGKGTETYQIIGTERLNFSDWNEITKF
ncbi:UDP-N-acetylmuramoyl-L-alanyl-D-glutamate--2,6-diaminopimelate ligase [bacterium]|nr:UDP-N-acetylmuramoyl-L-alanyl-D-glutamate--2,6-diaminopimelate ligase [bacterium]